MSTSESGQTNAGQTIDSHKAAAGKRNALRTMLPTLLGLILLSPLVVLVAKLNQPALQAWSSSASLQADTAANVGGPTRLPSRLDHRMRLQDLEHELALLAPSTTTHLLTTVAESTGAKSASGSNPFKLPSLPSLATFSALLAGSSIALASMWSSAHSLTILAALASCLLLLGLAVILARRKTHSTQQRPADQLIEGVYDGFVVLDENRRVSAHNKRLQKLLPENSEQPVAGLAVRTLYTQICNDSTQTLQKLDTWLANLHGDRTSSIELPDRANRQLLIRERPLDKGVITATVRDISEHRLTQEQLHYASEYDLLTGLPNRALFMSHLRDLVRKPKTSFALLICDLRDFRQINDSYGQQFGDRLLVETGEHLQEAMPDDAIVARLAGDEFAVLVENSESQQQLEMQAADFLEKMNSGLTVGARTLPVRASMGISYSPQDGTTVGELKSAADSACARAKSTGKNSIVSYNRRWQQVADRGHQLDIGLGKALANNEFELQYQPQIDISSNLTCGMEALLRWDSKSLGRVSPAEFIPRAERSDLIVEIGEWVIRQAIEDYQKLARFGMSPATLSINISRRQFDSEELVSNIKRIIKSSNINPSLITLEITETAILTNRDRAAKLLGSLHELGVGLSIDDFGVGYSSFLELRDFPINEVKIDRTFINDLATCEQSRQIIKATVAVAKSINAEVVAEGIETRQQFEMVKALGCHRAQGYFLCEPMSATTFPDVCLGGNRLSGNLSDNQFDSTVAI